MSGITQYVTFDKGAYFTSHDVFEVHPHCNIYWNFVPFYSWNIPYNHILVILFLVDGHLICFHSTVLYTFVCKVVVFL